MEHTIARRLATAREAARAAGAVHQQYEHRLGTGSLAIGTKQDNPLDLVSDVDQEAQAAAVRTIAGAFAPTWIVGEEGVVEVGPGGTLIEHAAPGHDERRNWIRPALPSYWLIDGLDGTGNYLRGLRPFCAAVAYVEAGRTIACAVYDPIADELFSAAEGRAATLNDAPTSVSTATTLEGAVIATETFRPFWSAGLDRWPRQLGMRTFGSPIASLAWVAAGRLDAYLYVDAGPFQRIGAWDTAPGSLLVQQAGGAVGDGTAWRVDIWSRIVVAAATPELRAAILARLPRP